MLPQHSKLSGSKSFQLTLLFSVGIPFLLVGLLLAMGLQWTGTSLAGDVSRTPPVPAADSTLGPGSFADLSERLCPTVVNVKVTTIEKAGWRGPGLPDGPFGDFFGRFFNEMPHSPKGRKATGAGSGVIINRDGTILTNNHVVEGASQVTITLANGSEHPAKVLGLDPKTDLAVLKIEADGPFPAAELGSSEKLRVGDWVMAIGNPFGLNHTVTTGIVSAKGRVIGAGPYDDFIQTDASINPGNSGGPLFNLQGEVVGINTAIVPRGQGIGFAIPVSTAKPLIPQLVTTGQVTRAFLGVSIQEITPDLAEALEVENREGALVADVTPGSPADKGGIQPGDIITSFDGRVVLDSHDLPAMVATAQLNETITLTIHRNGQKRQLSVSLDRLPSEQAGLDTPEEPSRESWGLQLSELTPRMARQLGLKTVQGVVVVGVQPKSPAQKAGIRQGDVIVGVNRQAVDSVDQLRQSIGEAGDQSPLLLLVQRRNGAFFVSLKQQG